MYWKINKTMFIDCSSAWMHFVSERKPGVMCPFGFAGLGNILNIIVTVPLCDQHRLHFKEIWVRPL